MAENVGREVESEKAKRSRGDGAAREGAAREGAACEGAACDGGARATWRDVPDGPLGVIASMIGPLEDEGLAIAAAVRAVLPPALTAVEIEIAVDSEQSMAPLLAAFGLAEGDAADDAATEDLITQTLATQKAFMDITLVNPSTRHAAVVGKALRRDNAAWNALLVKDCAASLLPLLDGLESNRALRTLRLLASGSALAWGKLTLEEGMAIGNACGAQGNRLQDLVVMRRCGDAGALDRLADGLPLNRTLRRLDLSLAFVDGPHDLARSAATLGDMLREQLTPLEAFTLRTGDALGDAAGAALAAGLARNTRLRELRLEENGIGIATCDALGTALAYEFSALRELSVNRNARMGDAAGARLVQGLARNQVLRGLSLVKCAVGRATCRALSEALGFEGSVLQELDLSNNSPLDDEAGAVIGRALMRNSAVEVLTLHGSVVGNATGEAIGAALDSPESVFREVRISSSNPFTIRCAIKSTPTTVSVSF